MCQFRDRATNLVVAARQIRCRGYHLCGDTMKRADAGDWLLHYSDATIDVVDAEQFNQAFELIEPAAA